MSARALARGLASAYVRRWPAFSRLFLIGDGVPWSIDEDLRQLSRIARRLDIPLAQPWPLSAAQRQAVFYGSHFTLFDRFPVERGHRLGTAYFHGRPGTPGMPEFDRAYAELRRRHALLARVQVSHREMEEVVLSSGIDPAKVFRIPVGVDAELFSRQTPDSRAAARQELGLPGGAFVVGSFQKDGRGWQAGLQPKPIKGPDVLVSALAEAHRRVPCLHVLLSGPARGYVRVELERRSIPYVHRLARRYAGVVRLYAALDAYVVASRQEGGPKGVLEAMAAGVPLVSTRVGQATDLVNDGENGWLVDVDDAEALAERLVAVAEGRADIARITSAGIATATANSYDAQLPLWRAFLAGLVERR